VTPHIIKDITAYDGTLIYTRGVKSNRWERPRKHWPLSAPELVSVCHTPSGAGYRFFKDFPYKVALKTGTPEFGTSSINTNGD
jgi:penicillin-binding protein 2